MRDGLRWLSVIAAVLGLDQLTKYVIFGTLALGERVSVLPFFDLVFVFNPGAAFSFLADHSGWQRWFFVVLAVVICSWLAVLLKRHAGERLMPLACALIIGGAIGNVIDRLIHGAVIDFLYFYVGRYGWPAFNVADSAITVGAALMVWAEWRAARKMRDAG
jgi:signal peptidase II